VPAVIAVVAYWCVALPVGAGLAFRGQLGAVGMWIGFASGLGAAAVGLLWRFHWRTRKTTSHRPGPPAVPETFPEHGALP
jgi:multidrug resistance protein, MATE family